MRLVQVAISDDRVDAILSTLDEAEIDYTVTAEEGPKRYDKVISFVLPIEAVEPVLDDLRTAGLTDQEQTVILDAETVISRDFESLKEEVKTETSGEAKIARQELQTRAEELTPPIRVYVTMTLISALVATSGLLLDSPAVVVGSMVIAPLIGPALSASVGTVVNDDELFHSGVINQLVGVAVAVVGAAVFAWTLRGALLVPPGVDVLALDEVAERLRPDLLSLFVALGAGVAGVLSLTTGVSTALVGVMIAAALIPPAAAVGVALAWGEPLAAIGASVLVLVNLVSINLAGLLTLWYSGYRPERFYETSIARRQFLQQVGLYGAAVGVLSSFLVASTVTAFRQTEFESAVDEAATAVLARDRYADLALLSVTVTFDEQPVLADPERVVVQVGTANDERHRGLAADLQTEIHERTGHEVGVQVQFVRLEEAS